MSKNPYYSFFQELPSKISPLLTRKVCDMLNKMTEDEFDDCVNAQINSASLFDYDNPGERQTNFDFRRIPESHKIYEAFREAMDDSVYPFYDIPLPSKPSRKERIKEIINGFLKKAFDILFLVFQIVVFILFLPIEILKDHFSSRLAVSRMYALSYEPCFEDELYQCIQNEAAKAALKAAEDSFSNRLRLIQVQKGITATKMAQIACISTGSYSEYLNARKFPDKNTIIRILIGCHLSLEASTELLNSAGHDWSNCYTDNVVRRYIKDGLYDLEKLNKELREHNCQIMTERRKYV